VETIGNRGPGAAETSGGIDQAAELRPARALAAVLVAGGAVVLCAMPAVVVLGVARLQVEQLAGGFGDLAAVLGGVKLALAAFASVGRWWSERSARLATTPTVDLCLG